MPTLATERYLVLDGKRVAKTPLLVPSFSSKGFPDIHEILLQAQPFLTEQVLISAYDMFYHKVPTPITFSDLIFLDSGGYEASKDKDFSDTGYTAHEPKTWNESFYRMVVASWPDEIPTVLTSYDHPDVALLYQDQIRNALELKRNRKNALVTLLVKPEEFHGELDINKFLPFVEQCAELDVLGFTEKQLGPSIYNRMRNIARLRRCLIEANLNLPIHVFGSLDTLSTPLYFLCGADIFDGLTWLRFAYSEGYTAYINNFGATRFGIDEEDQTITDATRVNNLNYLETLRNEMRTYLQTRDFAAFSSHASFLRGSYERLTDEISGGR